MSIYLFGNPDSLLLFIETNVMRGRGTESERESERARERESECERERERGGGGKDLEYSFVISSNTIEYPTEITS